MLPAAQLRCTLHGHEFAIQSEERCLLVGREFEHAQRASDCPILAPTNLSLDAQIFVSLIHATRRFGRATPEPSALVGRHRILSSSFANT